MPTSRLTDCSCGTFDMFRCCLTAKNAIRFSVSPTHSLLFSASLCFSPTQPTRLPHSLAFARPALPFQPTFSSLFSASITRLASACHYSSLCPLQRCHCPPAVCPLWGTFTLAHLGSACGCLLRRATRLQAHHFRAPLRWGAR